MLASSLVCSNSDPPGFAGNDSPSFVFPTAIATRGPTGGGGSSGSGRPAVANKPSFLTGGAGPGGHLSGKRGTEDLDFYIGDEALSAAGGSGYGINYPIRHGQIDNWVWQFGSLATCSILMRAGSYGTLLVQLDIQVPESGARGPPFPPY
jgi:hypothetical protein